MEDKREKFKRLATKRTNEILKRLKILGNCANKYAYEYNQDDIKKIFDAIEESLTKIKNRFHSESSQEVEEFKL